VDKDQKNELPERAERKPVDLRGYALAEGLDADIAISNMSYEGCNIECSEPLNPGDSVELRIIGRGGARAEVRWAKAGRAGVKFVG
jgi:hypothetical protein